MKLDDNQQTLLLFFPLVRVLFSPSCHLIGWDYKLTVVDRDTDRLIQRDILTGFADKPAQRRTSRHTKRYKDRCTKKQAYSQNSTDITNRLAYKSTVRRTSRHRNRNTDRHTDRQHIY